MKGYCHARMPLFWFEFPELTLLWIPQTFSSRSNGTSLFDEEVVGLVLGKGISTNS